MTKQDVAYGHFKHWWRCPWIDSLTYRQISRNDNDKHQLLINYLQLLICFIFTAIINVPREKDEKLRELKREKMRVPKKARTTLPNNRLIVWKQIKTIRLDIWCHLLINQGMSSDLCQRHRLQRQFWVLYLNRVSSTKITTWNFWRPYIFLS